MHYYYILWLVDTSKAAEAIPWDASGQIKRDLVVEVEEPKTDRLRQEARKERDRANPHKTSPDPASTTQPAEGNPVRVKEQGYNVC